MSSKDEGGQAFLDMLCNLHPSPNVIASASAVQLGLASRRCRWWVKRHKWMPHDPVLNSAGQVAFRLTYCKRCKEDRIFAASVSSVGTKP